MLGAGCWLSGNLVWLATGNPSVAVPSWLAFLVVTIAAERLELSRMRPVLPLGRHLFRAIIALMLAALPWALWQPAIGMRLFATSLLLLALWFGKYDIARYTVKHKGLTRFIAVCLLSGYVWVGACGLLGLFGALLPGHPWRDAALHALTLGFVFSMVLGHAPIVLPAVARIKVRYHGMFYAPLVALHVAVAVRVAGVLSDEFWLRRAGGEASALALAMFALVLLTSAWSARRSVR
jgi:hypothetical protein